MSLFRRRLSLPRTVLRSLTEARPDLGRPLAVAIGQDAGDGVEYAVALRAVLAYGKPGDWTVVGWHDVDHGAWNDETSTLELDQRNEAIDLLARPGGRRHRIRLVAPGRVPEVMYERVAATILFQRQMQIPDTSSVLTVTARRDLASQQVVWVAVPGRGVKVHDPDVREFAAAAVRRLEREYA